MQHMKNELELVPKIMCMYFVREVGNPFLTVALYIQNPDTPLSYWEPFTNMD